MELVESVVGSINGFLWGPPMIILLMGTHLFMTIRTKFVQRKIWTAAKLSVTSEEGDGDVSQFGALATALASTIGTGNIIGVGTAIALGGPGSVLWIWIAGVLGMASKYAEAFLSLTYRCKTEDGDVVGGPMYYLERGFKNKRFGEFMGGAFALFVALATFGIGGAVQSNAIASVVEANIGIPRWATGIIIAVLAAIVLIGGIKSITKVTTKLVPAMAAFYILGVIVIIFMNRAYVGDALALIFKAAFTPQAAGGGFVGSTLIAAARYGVARGLFSNESGMGSAPIVAAAATSKNPARQALVSMSGTFWDTVVVCALTGIMLVSSILAYPSISAYEDGGILTTEAFANIPVIGPIILTVAIITFAFSTILGWEYYGERGAAYLFGSKAATPYRVVFIAVVFIGTVASLDLVWSIADSLNALMAIPNLIALLVLSGVVVKGTQHYIWDGNLEEVDSEKMPVVSGRGVFQRQALRHRRNEPRRDFAPGEDPFEDDHRGPEDH